MNTEDKEGVSKAEEKSIIVNTVKEVIAQYGGMKLTLRQIFYRLVSKGIIKNTEQQYKKLGRILVEARKEKKIRYSDIEDRTRGVNVGGSSDYSAASYFRGKYSSFKNSASWYGMPRWWGQSKKVVVFLEKEALAALFERVTRELEVDLVVCRGYPSLTLMHDVAEHLSYSNTEDLQVEFLYFGDYDPSGADIERHVGEELSTEFGLEFNINRIAITREQIERYAITPAPAKTTDTRTAKFEEKEGVSWQVELDAIEPDILSKMVTDAINEHFDETLEAEREEELSRRQAKIQKWVNECLRAMPAIDEDDEEKE